MTIMNIYLLKSLCDRGYDAYRAKVIRSPGEMEARRFANENCGDEGRIWENPNLVSCKVLESIGPVEEILTDYKNG